MSDFMTLDIEPAGDPWLPCPGFFGFLLRVCMPSFFILSGRLTCKEEYASAFDNRATKLAENQICDPNTIKFCPTFQNVMGGAPEIVVF